MENFHDPAESTQQSELSSDANATTTTPPASQPIVSDASVASTTATATPPPSLTLNDSPSHESAQLSPSADPAPINKRTTLKVALYIVVGLLVLGGASFGSYLAGKHATRPTQTMTASNSVKTVPAGATIIEQCEPGLGTQYILPKDIPDGPVYNVYKGKLIGIEYMTDLATLQKLNTVLDNLPLYSQTYDHINIMSMPAHSGFPTPHYQVDVMMVPASTTKQITCGGASSNMFGMSGSSGATMNGSMPSSTSSSSKSSGM